MRAHEAGALHGDIGNRGPAWLRSPEDVNALVPELWPRTVTRSASSWVMGRSERRTLTFSLRTESGSRSDGGSMATRQRSCSMWFCSMSRSAPYSS